MPAERIGRPRPARHSGLAGRTDYARRVRAIQLGVAWRQGLLAVAIVAASSASSLAAPPSVKAAKPPKAAQKASALLSEEAGALPPGHLADEAFLRRLHLDLWGEPPSPTAITAFVLDPAPDKRRRAIDACLNDPRFGENWARYWRDVFLYRRNDERALLATASAVEYLAARFNEGAPWDQIARELITARGSIGENGATALLASQWGQTEDTAAEVSRVLMGVQIQCAQCHDHPTDDWKRTQFHELAAFFPRVNIRAIREEGKRRGFELIATDPRGNRPPPNAKAKARIEHYMPDMDDPSAEGTLMEPVFFVNQQRLPTGLSDAERREQLAGWITDPANPWFSRALVNRIWYELVGQGFYEPVDDLGPDRPCRAPKTLDYLAGQFVANGHDLKWLFRTITLCDAYQAEYRLGGGEASQNADSDCPQRLRADQVFDTLAAALGIPEPAAPPDRTPAQQRAARGTPRGVFNAAFGFDPSTPRDELAGSIEQALLLMNAPQINRLINSARTERGLGELLATYDDDSQVVAELYLRCLAREPKPDELAACLEYVAEIGDRGEALEDILWALINSTEFLHRN